MTSEQLAKLQAQYTILPEKAIVWCREECVRQGREDMLHIGYMCTALTELHFSPIKRTYVELLEHLGRCVEPAINVSGFRRTPVTVKGKVIPAYDFESLLTRLCGETALFGMSPDEWYKEFEELHPFCDGNGRVGSLMWNYFKGNPLDRLEVPADMWCER